METLQKYTIHGELYQKKTHGSLICYACGHRCLIKKNQRGICKVRYNENGILKVPFGYISGLQIDPIEKKPFFHAFPGSKTLSYGMLGCDFHCQYCQNWMTSQSLRDPLASTQFQTITPEEIIHIALKNQIKIITSTYNEPLITSEWSQKIFKLAKKEGLYTAYVSNGNTTPEVLDYLEKYLDLYKVDLKTFNDKKYRQLGGTLDTVIRSIQDIFQRGIWLEIVTLIIPGYNNSDQELNKLTQFIAQISVDIPWHVTAFHQDYRMQDQTNTASNDLIHAYHIGKKNGLNFIYTGNLPGQTENRENTYCPHCNQLLIERVGYIIKKTHIKSNQCPSCQTIIPGIW